MPTDDESQERHPVVQKMIDTIMEVFEGKVIDENGTRSDLFVEIPTNDAEEALKEFRRRMALAKVQQQVFEHLRRMGIDPDTLR